MRLATFVTGALAMSAFVVVLGCSVQKPPPAEPAAPGAPGAAGPASTSSAMPSSLPATPAK